MKPNINQTVGYVAPAAKPGQAPQITKGVVTETFEENGVVSARIDLTPRNAAGEAADPANKPLGHHTAIAAFNADKKTENTFHILEEETPAPKPALGK